MPNFSRNDVLLVNYPFSDLKFVKVRPAIAIHAEHISKDSFVIPLISQLSDLLPGEFILEDWEQAGLNVETAVKRGIATLDQHEVIRRIGNSLKEMLIVLRCHCARG